MKRKKSRHKQAAVEFLTNISLEGYPSVKKDAKSCLSITTAAHIASDPIEHDQQDKRIGFRKTQLSDATNIPTPKSTPEQYVICDKVISTPLSSNHWLQLKGQNCENACPWKTNSNLVCSVNTSLDESLVSNTETSTSGDSIAGFIGPKQPQLRSSVGGNSSIRDILSLKSVGTGLRPVNVKCLVISCGPRQTARSLFSVVQFNRRSSAVCNRSGHRANYAFGTANTVLDLSHSNGGLGFTAIHRSVSNTECMAQQLSALSGSGKPFTHAAVSTANSFAGDSARNVSFSNQTNFVRPTGDEVISLATFLRQCHPSFSTPCSTTMKHVHSHSHNPDHHSCHQCLPVSRSSDSTSAVGDPNPQRPLHLPASGPASEEVIVGEAVGLGSGFADQVEMGSQEHRAGRASHSISRHQPGSLLSCSANQSRFTGGSRRTRLDSTGKRGGSPTGGHSHSLPLVYPDPLVRYLPNLLDDPDLLVATGKRFLQLPGYLATLLTYVRPSEQKRNVNLEFHGRFPSIQLTLTKLRSLKADIVHTVHKMSFDLWIAAHACVLFEKLVLKLLVNKLNRKAYASAALLISAKLNDVKGPDLSSLIQEIEAAFRISRRDLLHGELDAFFNLEFHVIPSDSDILPHYLRIHRDIDVAPLVPGGCISRNLLQLRLNSLTDAETACS